MSQLWLGARGKDLRSYLFYQPIIPFVHLQDRYGIKVLSHEGAYEVVALMLQRLFDTMGVEPYKIYTPEPSSRTPIFQVSKIVRNLEDGFHSDDRGWFASRLLCFFMYGKSLTALPEVRTNLFTFLNFL